MEFVFIFEVFVSYIIVVIDVLVEKEWIICICFKEDRCIIRIYIMEDGEKIVDYFNQKKIEYFFKWFDCYFDEEFVMLIKLFSKLDKKC